MVQDNIADMLTRIRNANQMRNKEVAMPTSKMKVEIAKLLDSEGFIAGYTVKDNTLTFAGIVKVLFPILLITISSLPNISNYFSTNIIFAC